MEIRQWLLGLLQRARGVPPAPSRQASPMDGAVELWMRMYRGDAPWLSEEVVGLNLPAFIASEVARLSTVEFASRVTGGARATFLNQDYQRALREIRQAVEYAAACGSVVMKPYVEGGRIGVDFVRAGLYCPTAYDASGHLTGCAFLDRVIEGETVYTRVEHHIMEADGLRIQNLCFRARDGEEGLGEPVSLASVLKWADLLPEAFIAGVRQPLFALLKMPCANHMEPSSPMGVSCYARAVDLIREADKQFSRLLWEMESGQRALYVDIRAFSPEEAAPGALPFKRFYRMMDGGAIPEESLFEAWSPGLREESQIAALSCILQRIEDVCGFSRGTLGTGPEFTRGGARTATELSMMRQRTYALIRDVQRAIESALSDLLYAMDCWATALGLCEAGPYRVSFDFDDSIVCDRETAFAERMRLMEAGVIDKGDVHAWYFGEKRALEG